MSEAKRVEEKADEIVANVIENYGYCCEAGGTNLAIGPETLKELLLEMAAPHPSTGTGDRWCLAECPGMEGIFCQGERHETGKHCGYDTLGNLVQWDQAPTTQPSEAVPSIQTREQGNPSCAQCGEIMVRDGSGFKCESCGATTKCEPEASGEERK